LGGDGALWNWADGERDGRRPADRRRGGAARRCRVRPGAHRQGPRDRGHARARCRARRGRRPRGRGRSVARFVIMATWLRRHDPRIFGRRQKIGVVATALVTSLVLYVAGLFVFAAAMPRAVADPSLETDAIVVLTGGSQRLTSAFELMADKRARWLLVSGVNP